MNADIVRAALDYDPSTGVFIRKSKNPRWFGKPAGTLVGSGYIYIHVAGRSIPAHRLAWLCVTGEMPRGHIDHIDGDPTNNRISNLRDVDRATNLQNRRRPERGNKSGFLGVVPNKRRWSAQLQVNGRAVHLGTFDTPALAHTAYVEAKRIHHPGNTL